MPYLECPGCSLTLYGAVSHSSVADDCPVCGTSLKAAAKRFRPTPGARTLSRELPPTPSSAASARRALDGLRVELGESLHASAVLLVSELVSNSIQHSHATSGVIELFVCITPGVLRVEVSDDGEGFDPPPIAHDDADSGRGLHIVQELADRWGRPVGLRTSVWFEIDRPLVAPPVATAAPLQSATATA